jgi:hypothetical protein
MISELLLVPVLVRMAAAALVVIVASLASERAGPFWGAIVVSLPVSAGPAYVLLALEQDAAFVGASALTSLASHAATAAYLVVYARCAQRHGTAVCVIAALLTWLSGVLIVQAIAWTAVLAVMVNVIAFGLGYLATRDLVQARTPTDGRGRPWFDLPLRAASVGVLVAAVVTFSGALGPVVTGIGAVFPVAITSLGLTVQPRIGGPATAATMAAALRAMPGIGLGFLVLHLTAPVYGAGLGLSSALAAALLWPLTLVVLRARRERRARTTSSDLNG